MFVFKQHDRSEPESIQEHALICSNFSLLLDPRYSKLGISIKLHSYAADTFRSRTIVCDPFHVMKKLLSRFELLRGHIRINPRESRVKMCDCSIFYESMIITNSSEFQSYWKPIHSS